MPRQNLITGIDIGNSLVKTVIAEVDRDFAYPRIIGVGSVESRGLRKGVVVDMEETINNVGDSVRQAETMAGVKIHKALVGINGLHIRTQTSKGVIAVSRADNQISQSDIDRVIDAASLISLPANREIIHVLPRSFLIDGHEAVRNPLGMKGVRLEAEVFIIDGLSPHIHNLAKCVNANDIEVVEFVYSPMAVALAALDRQQKEYGVLNLDFGGGTSTLSIFNEGDLVHTGVLPLGSRHITNDLAVALRTTMDAAERVKLEHANLEAGPVSKKDHLDLSQLLGEENYTLPKKELMKIVEARVSELFDIITAEMKKIPNKYLLPGGLVLIGGGANLKGLVPFAKNRLGLPVKVADQYYFEGLTEKITDPSLAVAVGLVAWGFDKDYAGSRKNGPKSDIFSGLTSSGSANKLVSWFKNFLP